MNIQVSISKKAYKKICLHSFKYVAEDCIGVIVGSYDSNCINITDAYPLFHSRPLTPTLESALQLIECQLTDEKIIGVYESLSYCVGNAVSEVLQRILDGLSEQLKFEPILIQIYDEFIEDENSQKKNKVNFKFNISKYFNQGTQIMNLDQFVTNPNNMNFDSMIQDMQKGFHHQIIDFDNHFENCALDFRNQFIQE